MIQYVYKDGYVVAWIDANEVEIPLKTPIPADMFDGI